MKVNETVRHYLGMLLGFGLFFLLAFGGWELSEHSEWFGNLWASELNRWLLLLSCVVLIPMLLLKTYSFFWGRGKLIRTFKQKARSRISNCEDNDVVRIQGILVSLAKPLVAPFTQRECSAYTFRFSEKVQRVNARSRTEEAWQTSKYVENSKPFLIKCEDALALIRTDEAKVIVHFDRVHDESTYMKDSGGFLTKEENESRALALRSIGIEPRRFVGAYAEDLKFEEGVLQPNEQVTALGQGRWIKTCDEHELNHLHDEGIENIFEMKTSEAQQLIVSDAKYLLDDVKAQYDFQNNN
ncbi:MAG: hypothetical protein JXQ95_03530 [Alteromonas stellipolaris]|uniref:hypothetical protein n=1 Tax=Alteromonas stellipolaris TaxID=233316 RepID=UPI003B8B2044